MNYPPLSSVWLRVSDPLHGQFAAVTVGLLVLLPLVVRVWGRVLGVRATPAVWAVLYGLVALAGYTHWFLSGFHMVSTGFGSWPAMIATLLGVVCVGWAFDLRRPVWTGVLAGVSVLFNSTVAPGVMILILVVLVGSAGSVGVRAAARWAAVVSCVAVAVCGWWLVPFLDGWRAGRLVQWRVPLVEASLATLWQPLVVVVAVVLCAAGVAALGGRGRLAAAGCLGVALAAGVADRVGYLRAERWLTPALLLVIVLAALGAPTLWAARRNTPMVAAFGRGPGEPSNAGPEIAPSGRRGRLDGAGTVDGVAVSRAGRLLRRRRGTTSGTGQGPPGWHRGSVSAETTPDRGAEGCSPGSPAVPPPPESPSTTPAPDADTRHGECEGRRPEPRPTGGGGGASGSLWPRLLVSAGVVAVSQLTGLWVLAPAVGWVLWQNRSRLIRYAAPAWCGLLLVFPASRFAELAGTHTGEPSDAIAVAARGDRGGSGGLVYLQHHGAHPYGGLTTCSWGDPWAPVAAGTTGLVPLDGLYRETSTAAEFIHAERMLRVNEYPLYGPPMNHWTEAWAQTPTTRPDSQQAATALGASWLVTCDADNAIQATPITPRRISSIRLAPQSTNDTWHREATAWWANLLTNQTTLTEAEAAVPTHGEVDWDAYPPAQAAGGVSVLEVGESFAVTAQTAGWVWIRVPWDPYWHSHNNTPVLKGGPGHIVAWADEGHNNYGWWVPPQVDTAAIITTTVAAALATTLLITGRRQPQSPDLPSRRPTGRQSDKI